MHQHAGFSRNSTAAGVAHQLELPMDRFFIPRASGDVGGWNMLCLVVDQGSDATVSEEKRAYVELLFEDSET
jgi:hypothetical protein